jgi:hypothetical protein
MKPRPHNTLKHAVGVAAFSAGFFGLTIAVYCLTLFAASVLDAAREAAVTAFAGFAAAGFLYFVEDVCWRLPNEIRVRHDREEHRNDSDHQEYH